MDKFVLRREITGLKQAMRPEQIAAASESLALQFCRHPAYQRAGALFGYLSYNQEVRTLPILRQAQLNGKRVAVPKMLGNEMVFLWLDDLRKIAPGYHGIPEPVADGPMADSPDALVLMPGLAFDAAGRRLGYGGGFYDRFLAAEPGHPTLALCYDFQLVEQVPAQAHDFPVDFVLSAKTGVLAGI